MYVGCKAGPYDLRPSGVLGLTRQSFGLTVNASARPPRLVGLPTVGTCNYRYTGM